MRPQGDDHSTARLITTAEIRTGRVSSFTPAEIRSAAELDHHGHGLRDHRQPIEPLEHSGGFATRPQGDDHGTARWITRPRSAPAA